MNAPGVVSFNRLFPGLSQTEIEGLRNACAPAFLSAGQRVFNEGDLGDSMCIIETGAIAIVKTIDQDHERVLTTLPAGAIFGEMSFIDGRRRSAGARAVEDSNILTLGRPRFEQIARQHPRIGVICFANLASVIADRLRTANDQYREVVAEYLEATGTQRLGLGTLAEPLKAITLHTLQGQTLHGRVLDVVEGFGGGWLLHFKDEKGRDSLIPYHAIARIDVA
jgi:CRP-like cAMP-binding protein